MKGGRSGERGCRSEEEWKKRCRYEKEKGEEGAGKCENNMRKAVYECKLI